MTMNKKALNVSSKRSLLQRFAAAPHIVWSFLFIIIPLFFVAYYAFTDAEGAFTLNNISAAWTRSNIIVFLRSLKLSFFATLISLVIGYPAAYFISKAKPKNQRILIMLIMLPMWMNFLLRTYAWTSLLQDKGIVNMLLGKIGLGPFKLMYNENAVILGMVYDYLPYMILPIYSVMTKFDNRLIEAAADLGCNSFGVLRKVIFPLSLPGVISGITMVFVPSISTFYISQKLGGKDSLLIGDVIEAQYVMGNYNMVASLSFILMLVLLIGLAIVNKFADKDESGGIMP